MAQYTPAWNYPQCVLRPSGHPIRCVEQCLGREGGQGSSATADVTTRRICTTRPQRGVQIHVSQTNQYRTEHLIRNGGI
jgi:hypothetical protein